MTLKDWIAIWQEKYDAPSVRKTTYEAHRYVLQNHIVPRLGEYELDELTFYSAYSWPLVPDAGDGLFLMVQTLSYTGGISSGWPVWWNFNGNRI